MPQSPDEIVAGATRTSEAVIADTAKMRRIATSTQMEFNPVLNAELDRLMKEGKSHKEAAALVSENKAVVRKARAWACARYGAAPETEPLPGPSTNDDNAQAHEVTAPETDPPPGPSTNDDDAQARELYVTALALRETAIAAEVLIMHPTYRAAIAALTAKTTASYEEWLTSLCVLQQPGGVT